MFIFTVTPIFSVSIFCLLLHDRIHIFLWCTDRVPDQLNRFICRFIPFRTPASFVLPHALRAMETANVNPSVVTKRFSLYSFLFPLLLYFSMVYAPLGYLYSTS